MKRGVAPLVADAERRRAAKQELEIMQQQKAQIESSRAFINSKSDKVMYDRFDSDFNRAVDHLELSFEDQQSGLTCAQMTQLSLNLGFVKTCTEQEQTLLAQLWRILGGDEDGEGKVVLHFIKTIMCCI